MGSQATDLRETVTFDGVSGEPGPDRGIRDCSYQPGSKEDFDRLYRASYQRIFRTMIAIIGDPSGAEDCAQEAFLLAFKAWGRWKADAPPEAWIHRIAINTAISYRRKRRLREVGELIRRLGAPPEVDPTETAVARDLVREIRRLPSKQAAALVLRHLHGYTNREIAGILRVPESTVASRLMKAKQVLSARLAGSEDERLDASGSLRVPYGQ
ncbi:RNA polymerase sigma factor [Candidatus Nephthysia bennettiae]